MSLSLRLSRALLSLGMTVVVLTLSLSCGGSSPSSSSAPTPTPTPTTSPAPAPAPTPASTSLTGTVSSSTGARISGATVSALDGSNIGRTATADSNGQYRFDTMQAANGNFAARATGFLESRQGIFVNGATTLNFTLTPVPSFTGTWNGSARSQACTTEPPGLPNLCSTTLSDTLKLTLTQNSTAVGGTINFGGIATNTNGNATGTHLTLNDSSTVSQGVTVAYENFAADLSSSGSSISGTFSVRLASGAAAARYAMSFSGLVRSTALANAPGAASDEETSLQAAARRTLAASHNQSPDAR